MAFSTNYSCNYVFLIVFLIWGLERSEALGTFGFDVHHRYSHHVRAVFDFDHGLPEKGSFDYYAAMAHRDRLLRGRRLADVVDSEDFIFFGSNETYRIRSLGYLHYANVTVGTPSSWFLVALDTGSDLFWLPCDCTSPATCSQGGLSTRSGQKIDFNIYSTNISTTSTSVTCSSTFCKRRRRCSAETDACPYQVNYLSSNTSSTGVLVEDVLHLATDDNPLKAVDANITFGCGKTQTGSFLDGAAPNGLFGLGMDQVSVPSVLASKGVAANSFSMCFGPDGLGRIRFGDKGSSNQSETPFNVDEVNPTYNISVTQIIVGGSFTNLSLTAIFDSGTSFTYLTDPAYSTIAENFDNIAQEKRFSANSRVPFEYCYELSDNQTSFEYAALKLKMKGGQQFSVTDPIVIVSTTGDDLIYCLGLVKSEDIDIIGQNFMTGYNVVFDREKMVLGWEASDCYGGNKTATLPINPKNNVSPPDDAAAPPGATVKPEARAGNRNGSPSATPALPGNHAPHFNSFAYTFLIVFGSLLTHYLAILSL